ncbi:MAG: non-canonical purine NTP pyrophosphatase, partial [Chloroflexi bacterium]
MPDRPRLVIASGNQGKLREYRDLLAAAGLELIAFDTEVDEVGESYADNARLKAEAAVSRSGLPALGDDSGLEVDALGGLPGIRSARLGPTQKERTAELLRRLEGVPRPWTARFVCVVALAVPGQHARFFEGECRGE